MQAFLHIFVIPILYLAFLIGVPIAALFAIYKVVEMANRRGGRNAARGYEELSRLWEEEARKRRFREEQDRYRDELTWIANQSIDVYEIMPKLLIDAEIFLDQAETDFRETAFSPFWDTIEKAANKIGRFDEALQRINKNSIRYAELVRLYVGNPQKHPLTSLSVSKLDAGKGTIERLKSIVRKAQRNRDFALIYEQRKTNQILVAGFTNLAQALDLMSSQITVSLDNLSNSVDILSATMKDSMSEIRDAVSSLHEDINEHESERAWREKKASEMLDNIQRGRKPFI